MAMFLLVFGCHICVPYWDANVAGVSKQSSINLGNTFLRIPRKQTNCTDLNLSKTFRISLKFLACENIRFSSLFAAGDVSRGGTSATQRQKFHSDDAIQCLHNKSSSHGVPNTNLSNLTCLLVDFGKVLCSSANKLQQKLKCFF